MFIYNHITYLNTLVSEYKIVNRAKIDTFEWLLRGAKTSRLLAFGKQTRSRSK